MAVGGGVRQRGARAQAVRSRTCAWSWATSWRSWRRATSCWSTASAARSWTSYFATLLNHHPNDFRIHATSLNPDYSRLDPIALICVLAVASTKGTSRFNYVLSILHIAVILFIIVAGLTHADARNMRDFMPHGVRGIFSASAVLLFAYIGFDAVSTMAEETRNIPVGGVTQTIVAREIEKVINERTINRDVDPN